MPSAALVTGPNASAKTRKSCFQRGPPRRRVSDVNGIGCSTLLAAGKRQPPVCRAHVRSPHHCLAPATTSPSKTRARSSCRQPSGRFSRQRPVRPMFTPGSRTCGYRTASGLGKWLSRDPIGERGGINFYSFVANFPVSRYDLLGLTIPGTCAEAFPNSCPCKCVSVTVTFSPGNGSFQWGWIANADGSSRFGNNMHVSWKVQGPAFRCKYAQRESGVFFWWNLDKPTQPPKIADWSAADGPIEDAKGTCSWGHRDYTDRLGGTFVSPTDDGNWTSTVATPPSITLECTSSDGTKTTKLVSLPSPPDPGKFPSQ